MVEYRNCTIINIIIASKLIEIITKAFGDCGDTEWYSLSNICYKVVDTSSIIKYASASSICQSSGGGLVKVDSRDVRQLLIDIMSTNEYYWIGLRDIDETNNPTAYRWIIDNEVASGYVDWGYYQPHYYYQDCVVYAYRLQAWGWYDVHCEGIEGFRAHYICQKCMNIIVLSNIYALIEIVLVLPSISLSAIESSDITSSLVAASTESAMHVDQEISSSYTVDFEQPELSSDTSAQQITIAATTLMEVTQLVNFERSSLQAGGQSSSNTIQKQSSSMISVSANLVLWNGELYHASATLSITSSLVNETLPDASIEVVKSANLLSSSTPVLSDEWTGMMSMHMHGAI
ncbi:C-type mannose receptor 2 [Trichoplax sp. H2]|nr:C-type mannose receptor 2 [Trichoplax sp. H2]|eukprot:RDD44515.1 C-type mannose receptor 2 [Trichoplax sp. H2]